MVNSSGPVNVSRNRETCIETGFTVSDFSFRVIKSIAWRRRIRRRIRQSIIFIESDWMDLVGFKSILIHIVDQETE